MSQPFELPYALDTQGRVHWFNGRAKKFARGLLGDDTDLESSSSIRAALVVRQSMTSDNLSKLFQQWLSAHDEAVSGHPKQWLH